MNTLIITLALLFSGRLANAPAWQRFPRSTEAKVDNIINTAIADSVFRGAVVCVVQDDKIAFCRSYGNRLVIPEPDKMKRSTIFDLASNSKVVSTTIAAMQLVEKGKLDLDAPVKQYIKDYRPFISQPSKRPKKGEVFVPDTVDIKVRDLLYHVSGLPAYRDADRLARVAGHESPSMLKKYITKDATRLNRPGTKYRYSCLGFISLQMIIEAVTKQKLCDYAAKNIFSRLGMGDTRYFPDGADEYLLDRIAPTETFWGGKPWHDGCDKDRDGEWTMVHGMVHDALASRYMNGNSGNAGVFSTADDLAVFCAALMNGGALYRQDNGTLGKERSKKECRILKPETIELMCTPDSLSGRVMGWDRDSKGCELPGSIWDRGDILCHTGFTGPSIVINRRTRTAVILLCSRLHPENRSGLRREHAMLGDVRSELSDAVAAGVEARKPYQTQIK